MPTYDYECQRCGHQFERFQSMSDPPVKTCPKCRGKVRRLIGTGAGIIFKGEGFYITDYRSKDYKEKAGKDKPSVDKPAEAPAGSGGDAKPEVKPDGKSSKKPAGKKKGSAKPD